MMTIDKLPYQQDEQENLKNNTKSELDHLNDDISQNEIYDNDKPLYLKNYYDLGGGLRHNELFKEDLKKAGISSDSPIYVEFTNDGFIKDISTSGYMVGDLSKIHPNLKTLGGQINQISFQNSNLYKLNVKEGHITGDLAVLSPKLAGISSLNYIVLDDESLYLNFEYGANDLYKIDSRLKGLSNIRLITIENNQISFIEAFNGDLINGDLSAIDEKLKGLKIQNISLKNNQVTSIKIEYGQDLSSIDKKLSGIKNIENITLRNNTVSSIATAKRLNGDLSKIDKRLAGINNIQKIVNYENGNIAINSKKGYFLDSGIISITPEIKGIRITNITFYDDGSIKFFGQNEQKERKDMIIGKEKKMKKYINKKDIKEKEKTIELTDRELYTQTKKKFGKILLDYCIKNRYEIDISGYNMKKDEDFDYLKSNLAGTLDQYLVYISDFSEKDKKIIYKKNKKMIKKLRKLRIELDK